MTEQIVSYHSNGVISKIYSKTSGSVFEFLSDGLLCKSYNYKDGERTGVYKEYFKNGLYSQVSSLENGKKHGVSSLFFENGKLKEYSSYFVDLLHGVKIEYNRFGKIYSHEQFRFGKSISPKFIYYDDSLVKYLIYYEPFRRDCGRIEHYSRNQILLSINSFQKYRKHGEYLKFYHKGNLSEKSYYKNGILHGTIEKYLPNGNCYFRGYYKNGKRHGIFLKWDNQTVEKSRFKKDKLHGLYILQDKETHEKLLTLYYQNETLHGIQTLHSKRSRRFYRDNYFMLIESMYSDCCSVCWNNSRWKTPCGHFLCISCANRIEQFHCPLCRKHFVKKRTNVFYPFERENFIKED